MTRTLAAQGRSGVNDKKKSISEASPTFAHYACTELVKKHFLKFIITTNMVRIDAKLAIFELMLK